MLYGITGPHGMMVFHVIQRLMKENRLPTSEDCSTSIAVLCTLKQSDTPSRGKATDAGAAFVLKNQEHHRRVTLECVLDKPGTMLRGKAADVEAVLVFRNQEENHKRLTLEWRFASWINQCR